MNGRSINEIKLIPRNLNSIPVRVFFDVSLPVLVLSIDGHAEVHHVVATWNEPHFWDVPDIAHDLNLAVSKKKKEEAAAFSCSPIG